jgi:2-polyprenyl-3-methyl-5-hydroxy-6-metoxy-1,4-benzoquinol methylase
MKTQFMDYKEQQQYLDNGRMWGAGFVLLVVAMAAASLQTSHSWLTPAAWVFGLLLIALAVFLYYTPDYLHLTVNPQKTARWAIKIRWRLILAAMILGLLMASSVRGRAVALIAVVLLIGINLLAKSVPRQHVAFYFWTADFVLLSILLLLTPFDLLLGTALLAAAAHLAIVTQQKPTMTWPVVVIGCSCLLILLAVFARHASLNFGLALAGLPLAAGFGTAWLVHRAEDHNANNIAAAVRELTAFTGHSEERIRQLWAVSNQELAKNWQQAAIPHDDRERLAEWYRQNSELYLFAISGYNLEYKRIRSNLNVLKFARGSCLDYGAGNGEILLELAKRGHPVTYYDVEGETMRFARQRSQQRGVEVEFFHSRDGLAAAAQKRGFDTIFSLDVLEHLPDLTGELSFLSSMLNPGGLFVFDVPAGSTASHPMHLNHELDVVAYLRARGLHDHRSLLKKLPFKKEEKYVFRAAAGSTASSKPESAVRAS